MKMITHLDNINKINEKTQKEDEEEISQETKNKKIITKKSIEKLSKLNEKNEKLRNENKKRIEERKKIEILNKERFEKDKKAYERTKQILQNGYNVYKVKEYNGNKLPKVKDDNRETDKVKIRSRGNGMFQEEEYNIGTNLSPNIIINNEINNNNKNRPNSSYKIGNNNNLNIINKNIEISPEEKLKLILQKDLYNLEELLQFQKKYKYIDVEPYIHYAKMNLIKNNKNKNETKRPLSSNKIKPNEILVKNNTFPDKKLIKIEDNQSDKKEIEKFSESNNNMKIYKIREKINKNFGKILLQDMRLLELLSIIKEEILKKNIDIKELFHKLDKNKNGKLSLREFKKLFTTLKIENINEEDITYVMSYFDINKDGKLQYQEFLSLLC